VSQITTVDPSQQQYGYPQAPGAPAQVVIHNGSPAALPPLQFTFDGGLATYIGRQILAALLTIVTLGIALPWAICMTYGWKTNHTLINGQRLRFTGTGMGLFGQWIKWLLLSIVTFGIYLFWVNIKLTKWKVEHQELRTN
jgi:uncharacterized membrane protein YjgN (DUF898 family)